MNGIGQLFKGVLIGLVLLLAVVGLLKLSGKAGNPEVATQTDIPAPSISVNKSSATTAVTNTESETPLDKPDEDSAAKNTEEVKDDTQASFKPEILEEPISYGTLNLSAKQKVEFLIYDENNKRVAASKNNSKASFHLPTGRYKVITLLGELKETQTIIIEKDKISDSTVSIQAPITTGVLKVAAISAKSKQSIKTSFSIEDNNGKLVGKRHDVSSTLFKLDAGTYKITAMHNDMSEVRTVIVEAGTSSQQIFSLKRKQVEPVVVKNPVKEPVKNPLNEPVEAPVTETPTKQPVVVKETIQPEKNQVQEIIETVKTVAPPITPAVTPAVTTTKPDTEIKTAIIDKPKSVPVIPVEQQPAIPEIVADVIKQGTLNLSAVSANTQKPVKSNFYVQTTNGKHIAKKIYTNSASFKLDKGTYRITIKSKNMTTVTKTVTVNTDRKLNQIFSMHGIAATKIPAITPSATAAVTPETIRQNTPQTTVRSHSTAPTPDPTKNATKDTTKTNTNQTRNNQATRPAPSRNTQTHTKPKPRSLPASGSLVFNIQRSRNRLSAPNALLSNFVIKTKSGKKIAQINKVQHATVKLDVGEYVITANHRGRRKSRSFKISNNRATNVSFKSSDFSAFKPQAPVKIKRGILKSRVVNNQGRAVKGNISVTDLRGKLLHRANNVSTAQFHLPAKPYMVHINYKGLKGSERVKIIPGETTVQTFTIADAPPQTRRPQSQSRPQPQQQPNRSRNTQRETMSGRDLRHAIGDKVKEEFRRITR